jgi:hypothetical protein
VFGEAAQDRGRPVDRLHSARSAGIARWHLPPLDGS